MSGIIVAVEYSSMATLRLFSLALPCGFLLKTLPLHAQESAVDDAGIEEVTKRCISTRRIRRIRIVEDKNILFYLTATHVYHNQLRNECHGLKRYGTFSYNSNDGLFCDGDGIGGMTMDAWDDVRPNVNCWLGLHRKITREEANEMRRAARNVPSPEAKPLPMPHPSVIGTEETVPEPES